MNILCFTMISLLKKKFPPRRKQSGEICDQPRPANQTSWTLFLFCGGVSDLSKKHMSDMVNHTHQLRPRGVCFPSYLAIPGFSNMFVDGVNILPFLRILAAHGTGAACLGQQRVCICTRVD